MLTNSLIYKHSHSWLIPYYSLSLPIFIQVFNRWQNLKLRLLLNLFLFILKDHYTALTPGFQKQSGELRFEADEKYGLRVD